MKFLFCLILGAMTARMWFRILANTYSRPSLIGSRGV